MPTGRSTPPAAATCWRPGGWPWPAIRPAFRMTPGSRKRTWGHDRIRSDQMIGVDALYFLFAWLISAAAASWLSERKGYGERVGLTFGLILSALGLLIVLLLPARPNSKWRDDGWRPRRRTERFGTIRGRLGIPASLDGGLPSRQRRRIPRQRAGGGRRTARRPGAAPQAWPGPSC